jgi:hypothetical protein
VDEALIAFLRVRLEEVEDNDDPDPRMLNESMPNGRSTARSKQPRPTVSDRRR